jgi:hypothetical protein
MDGRYSPDLRKAIGRLRRREPDRFWYGLSLVRCCLNGAKLFDHPVLDCGPGGVRQSDELDSGLFLGPYLPNYFSRRLDQLVGPRQPEGHSRELVRVEDLYGLNGQSGFADVEDNSSISVTKLDVGERVDVDAGMGAALRDSNTLRAVFGAL